MQSNFPVIENVEQRRVQYAALADRIWATPELNWAEYLSCEAHAEMILAEGFTPLANIGGIPTAVGGEWGSGGPVIAFLGEYDALPGLSQVAGEATERPVEAEGSGHGCGHNLLGAASLMAAAAVKDWLEKTKTPGRVRYVGCPAEEGGSSKGFMVRSGVFDDVDFAISWHPGTVTGVMTPVSLANVEVEFTFLGRAAHAASHPHRGRSALDAVELMNVGVNYLREHMPPNSRLHYAITDTGGSAPNVVQAQAKVRHLVRTASLSELWPLFDRVLDIARGAALMTGTELNWRQVAGEANLVQNTVLENLMDNVLRSIGDAGFDSADQDFGGRIQQTLGPEELDDDCHRFGISTTEPLTEQVVPMGAERMTFPISTDVGSVSWVVPTVQCWSATCAIGTPLHSWQMVAQGCTPAAHKGMTRAAKAMAETAVRLFADPDLRRSAKDEHKLFRSKHDFRNPVADVATPFVAVES